MAIRIGAEPSRPDVKVQLRRVVQTAAATQDAKSALRVAIAWIALSGAAAVGHAEVTWNVTFQDVVNHTNVGFDDPNLGLTRRGTVLAALVYIGGEIIDENGSVDITVKNSEMDGTSFLAFAGPLYHTQPNGFQGGYLREHLLTGVDPSGTSSDATATFDFGYNWNSGLGPPTAAQVDLFSVALHEFTHALGFATLVNGNGTSQITSTSPGVFSTYDAFLKRNGNALFGPGGTFIGNVTDLTSNQVTFNGPNATNFNGGAPIPVFSPNPFQPGSSIGHTNTSVMGPTIGSGQVARAYVAPEIGILKDLGYHLRSDTFWANSAGGTFQAATNWSDGVPTGTSSVDFSRGQSYTVAFTADVSNKSLRVGNDSVTFDLNSRTYSLSGAAAVHMGTLSITDGGVVANGSVVVGDSVTSDGTLMVAGPGASLTAGKALDIGLGGKGQMDVRNNAVVTNTTLATIGNQVGSRGDVTIGPGGHWNAGNFLNVANSGTGTLTISDSGSVSVNGSANVGDNTSSYGTLTVTGAGSSLTTNGSPLTVGNISDALGKLNIYAGGSVSNGVGKIGVTSNSNNIADIDGAGSTWTSTQLDIGSGSGGKGQMDVRNNAVVTNTTLAAIGNGIGSRGDVTIRLGAHWNAGNFLNVANSGTGTLTISDGGSVSVNGSANVGDNTSSNGTLTVTGAGSRLTTNGNPLTVGNISNAVGTLTIQNGGVVSTGMGAIGAAGTASGHVNIAGTAAAWNVAGSLFVGGNSSAGGGAGAVTIQAGGTLTVGNVLKLWPGGTFDFSGGTLSAQTLDLSSGGAFDWNAGTLRAGTVNGSIVNEGGTLAPGNSPGLTTIIGNYVQQAGNLDIEIGGLASSQYDTLAVTGQATLSGTLTASLVNGFVPSIGDSFSVLTFSSRTADFNSYVGMNLPGHLALRSVLSTNSLVLKARPAIDGDLSLDGVVDISDVQRVASKWLTSNAQGDANDDGFVDISDVQTIAAHWLATGGGNGTGIAIPEPETGALALVALAGLFAVRRTGRTENSPSGGALRIITNRD